MPQIEITDPLIVIKGAGEKATAVAHTLFSNGYRRILMTEVAHPRSERRGITFSEAVFIKEKNVQGVTAVLADLNTDFFFEMWKKDLIPLVVDPALSLLNVISAEIVIDGVMAKKNTGTSIQIAKRVIALGPGFCAGKDAHAVIETRPQSEFLGRAIFRGWADENTHEPSIIKGIGIERLIFSSETGSLELVKDISDKVEKGAIIATVSGVPVRAPIGGTIFGIMRDRTSVKRGEKIGDMDPRGQKKWCHRITSHSRMIACGVLTLIRSFLPLSR